MPSNGKPSTQGILEIADSNGVVIKDVNRLRLGPSMSMSMNTSDPSAQIDCIGSAVSLQAPFWSIDETNGSDSNVGSGVTQSDADLHPVKTLGEINRRLSGSMYDSTVTIHQLSDVTSANFSLLPNLRIKNVNGYPVLRGKKISINGSPIAVTGYATHVPSSNTGYLVTASGVGSWAPYVDKLIENASGSKAGFVRSFSGTTARLTGGMSSDVVNAPAVNAWAVSDQLTAYTLPRIPAMPFSSECLFWAAEYMQYGFGSHDGSFAFSNWGASSPFLNKCISEGAFSNGGKGGSFSTVLFLSNGTLGSESNIRSFSGFFQGCAVKGLMEFGAFSLVIPQDISGVPSFDIESGQISLESSTMLGSSGASLSVFNCASSVIKDTSGSNATDAASHIMLQGPSNIYGSGNSSYILNLPVGHHSVHKDGFTATTSLTHPIRLATVDKDVANIPVSDTTNGAWLLDK